MIFLFNRLMFLCSLQESVRHFLYSTLPASSLPGMAILSQEQHFSFFSAVADDFTQEWYLGSKMTRKFGGFWRFQIQRLIFVRFEHLPSFFYTWGGRNEILLVFLGGLKQPLKLGISGYQKAWRFRVKKSCLHSHVPVSFRCRGCYSRTWIV